MKLLRFTSGDEVHPSERWLLFFMGIALNCTAPILEAIFHHSCKIGELWIRQYNLRTLHDDPMKQNFYRKQDIPPDILRRLYKKRNSFDGYNVAVVGEIPLPLRTTRKAVVQWIENQHRKMEFALVKGKSVGPLERLDFPFAYCYQT
jgi:hypothetical protein